MKNVRNIISIIGTFAVITGISYIIFAAIAGLFIEVEIFKFNNTALTLLAISTAILLKKYYYLPCTD